MKACSRRASASATAEGSQITRTDTPCTQNAISADSVGSGDTGARDSRHAREGSAGVPTLEEGLVIEDEPAVAGDLIVIPVGSADPEAQGDIGTGPTKEGIKRDAPRQTPRANKWSRSPDHRVDNSRVLPAQLTNGVDIAADAASARLEQTLKVLEVEPGEQWSRRYEHERSSDERQPNTASHSGLVDRDEALGSQLGEQLDDIPHDDVFASLILCRERAGDVGDRRGTVAQIPDPRADLVEGKIRTAVEVEEHRLAGRLLGEHAVTPGRSTPGHDHGSPALRLRS
jgi:hypothetical protein